MAARTAGQAAILLLNIVRRDDTVRRPWPQWTPICRREDFLTVKNIMVFSHS
jgi:hypothetical protein